MDRKKDTNRTPARRSRLSLLSRRRFVKSAGAATVAIGFGTTSMAAEELPRVEGPIPEVLERFAAGGETVFHDCALHGNPSHTGLADLAAQDAGQ